jgi:pentatricopeptide repeat protein
MFKMSQASPEILRLFAAILSSFQKAQAYPQFWSTLEEIRKMSASFGVFPPFTTLPPMWLISSLFLDLNMYNEVIKCLARMKAPNEKKMVEFFEEIKEKKLQPNQETYDAFILGLSKTSILTLLFYLCFLIQKGMTTKLDIKHARQRYHQMVREDFTPTSHTIHILIKGYCDAGMTGDCIEFFHVLRRAGVAISASDVHMLLATMLELSEHQQAAHFLEFFARENTWLNLESCNIFLFYILWPFLIL